MKNSFNIGKKPNETRRTRGSRRLCRAREIKNCVSIAVGSAYSFLHHYLISVSLLLGDLSLWTNRERRACNSRQQQTKNNLPRKRQQHVSFVTIQFTTTTTGIFLGLARHGHVHCESGHDAGGLYKSRVMDRDLISLCRHVLTRLYHGQTHCRLWSQMGNPRWHCHFRLGVGVHFCSTRKRRQSQQLGTLGRWLVYHWCGVEFLLHQFHHLDNIPLQKAPAFKTPSPSRQ